MKTAAILLTIIISAGTTLAFWGDNVDAKSTRFKMAPKSSKSVYSEWDADCEIKVFAKANKGKIHLKVYNPKGETVASGKSKARINTRRQKGKYKIVLENRTNKYQNVILQNVSKLCHDTVVS